jgi:hypothetical protein
MSDWETLTTVGTEEEAALVAGFLDGAGIPAEIESLLFHQEPVTFGRLGEVRVKVPAERLAEARAALASAPPLAADAEPPGE